MSLPAAVRAKLKTVSVATLTTCLFKRGLRNQFIQDVHPLNPAAGPMVGEAFTLRYIPAREDLNPITVFQDRAHPQRKAIEECPPGAVMVYDSRKNAWEQAESGMAQAQARIGQAKAQKESADRRISQGGEYGDGGRGCAR